MDTPAGPTFDDLDDPTVIRHRMLSAVARAVVAEHARKLAVHVAWWDAGTEFAAADDRPLDVDPSAALADACIEADAHWQLDTTHLTPGVTIEEYRDIAADAYRRTGEQLAAIVGSCIAEARRTAGLRYG